MPPYAKTSHPRIRRYDLHHLTTADGRPMGVGTVVGFQPEHVPVTEDRLASVALRDLAEATRTVALPPDGLVLVNLPGLGQVPLPPERVGEKATEPDPRPEPDATTLRALFQATAERARAGETLEVQGDGDEAFELVWRYTLDDLSTPRGKATVTVRSGSYEGDSFEIEACVWSPEALGRQEAWKAIRGLQQDEWNAHHQRLAEERVRLAEARARAAWPRFELHRSSLAVLGDLATPPHPAAVYNEQESRWEVAAPSLDALFADTLADVRAPMMVEPRGKTAPANVLTVVVIEDVDSDQALEDM
jgi:hypothetical protein